MTDRELAALDAGPETPLPWTDAGAPRALFSRAGDVRYLFAAANAAPALRAEVVRLRAALLRVENVVALQGNAAEVLATIREALEDKP